jgi:hypothetical protein
MTFRLCRGRKLYEVEFIALLETNMQNQSPKASRRGFFMTASIAGAAVAATSLIKTQVPEPHESAPAAMPKNGGGYSLSEHVKRYYKTTLV